MFKFMGNKRLFLLLAAIMFFIAIMGFSLSVRGGATWPEKFVADTVAFGQGLVYKPVRSVAGFFEDVRRLKTVYEENQALRLTLSQYARDTARLNDLEAQNARLKEALEFTERQKRSHEYTYRIAEVISESPDRYNRVVRINLGERDGIRMDMAVMTVDGLIGRIVRVTPFTSNVQLITDLNGEEGGVRGFAATVQGRESESFGIVENYNAEEGTLLMTKIDQNDELKEGDVIVTSGLGELFPEGIVIGTVIDRKVGDFGLTHTATIEPAAQFSHLREVFVVEVPGLE
ncbi:rod shape-determining protein MreC [Paenibacillus antri]|uniref:Cell shape-determining protein MreC n=1 Tax=Paenibacillus antri TaxID=2582848 RepID=A0A5R9GEG7_9BACL|nr:rod shape-determining protein MreC [Paenibacillus antri]TLS53529.1 rod shape-determining protein MreC [Paenibacillus antri]